MSRFTTASRALGAVGILVVLSGSTAACKEDENKTEAAQAAERQPDRAEPTATSAVTAPPKAPIDDPSLSPLERTLARVRAARKVPAIAALVVRSTGRVAAAVVGKRSKDADERATLQDRFHIGSNTKAMTAMLIGTLVEDGTLTWETTLAETLPAYRDRMLDAYKSVTIRQLLGNRGGFTNKTVLPGLSLMDMHMLSGSPREQRAVYVEKALSTEPQKEAGRFVYSNTGYVVAGAIVEAATDTSWEEATQKRLFTPMGMTSAGFGAPGTIGGLDQPWGHAHNPLFGLKPVAPGPNADNPVVLGPAGRVHLSIEHYGAYLAAHLRGARGQKTLLKPETMEALHTPVPGPGQPYALGWMRVERKEIKGPLLTHDGSNTMWYASAWIAPDADLAVAAIVNAGGSAGQKAAHEVVKELLQTHAME